ncbi:unnamed protein product [Pleuronectes platessa]|uniref:Uncharacterized protein n=1 Tax=Pleuronectes platessa TaxID=8262 RepID=A0A9N7YHZ4_PLEPL|nr:unnamed protein product [Pleuronectes platessa]
MPRGSRAGYVPARPCRRTREQRQEDYLLHRRMKSFSRGENMTSEKALTCAQWHHFHGNLSMLGACSSAPEPSDP